MSIMLVTITTCSMMYTHHYSECTHAWRETRSDTFKNVHCTKLRVGKGRQLRLYTCTRSSLQLLTHAMDLGLPSTSHVDWISATTSIVCPETTIFERAREMNILAIKFENDSMHWLYDQGSSDYSSWIYTRLRLGQACILCHSPARPAQLDCYLCDVMQAHAASCAARACGYAEYNML